MSRETTPNDPTSRDHDVKIVLDEHILIVGVTRWTLTFLMGGQQFTSSLDAVTETDGIQREFVFKTELVEGATAVLLTAKGRSGSVLATGTAYVQIPSKWERGSRKKESERGIGEKKVENREEDR